MKMKIKAEQQDDEGYFYSIEGHNRLSGTGVASSLTLEAMVAKFAEAVLGYKVSIVRR